MGESMLYHAFFIAQENMRAAVSAWVNRMMTTAFLNSEQMRDVRAAWGEAHDGSPAQEVARAGE
jgi:hypothetical protein